VIDFLLVIIELYFAISDGSDVISGNLFNLAFFKGVGHFECKFQMEGGVVHQPLLVSKN